MRKAITSHAQSPEGFLLSKALRGLRRRGGRAGFVFLAGCGAANELRTWKTAD